MTKGGITRFERIFASPWLFGLEIAVLVLASVALALLFEPEPFSDWQYYWEAAGVPGRYERGGAVLLLFGALKSFGAPPHLTVVWPNLFAAIVILSITRRIDPLRGKGFSHLVAAYLLLLTPYHGQVQMDVLAAMCLVIGWVLSLRPPERWPRAVTTSLAIVAFALAVSSRPQFLLVVAALTGLACGAWMIGGFRRTMAAAIAPALCGALFGFALDSGLRAQADRSGAIRTTSSVTLYAGLLVSTTTYPDCGQWSERATVAMRADLGKPLPHSVIERLRERPLGHWMAVMACKAPQIVVPPAFAWWWLAESPNVEARLAAADPAMERMLSHAVDFQSWVYRGLVLLIYLGAIGVAWRYARRWPPAILPLLWILAFWCVHLVLEVQGRYFLSMLLIAPVLSALALRGGVSLGGPGRAIEATSQGSGHPRAHLAGYRRTPPTP